MQSCANLSSQAKTIAGSVVLFSLIFFSPTSVKADGNNSSVKTLEISGQPDQKWQTVGEVFDIRNTGQLSQFFFPVKLLYHFVIQGIRSSERQSYDR